MGAELVLENNRIASARLARAIAIIMVLTSVAGAVGWFWWSATHKAGINFLPRRSPGKWIVYPTAPDLVLRPRIAMSTVFKRIFVTESVPASAKLMVAGFHLYSVSINTNTSENLISSTAVAPEGSLKPVGRGATWKEPDVWEVAKLLRVGTNVITVTVINSNGPPALWLSLELGGKQVNSDEAWQASYAGAAWRDARVADKPKIALAGNPVGAGETPSQSLAERWGTLMVFLGVAGLAAGVVKSRKWKAESRQQLPIAVPGEREGNLPPSSGIPRLVPREEREKESLAVHGYAFGRCARRIVGEHWPVLVCVAFWIALFANNLTVLPKKVGFDVDGHTEYIAYIQQHGSLPLAGQGWETFQPPLYYVLCAGLLRVLSLSIAQLAGIFAVRVLGLCIGIAHLVIIWGALRLIFPEQRARQSWGLLLATCVPSLLYISHYVSNEGLAAMLVSACILVCLRILRRDAASWRLHAALGIFIGLALLTKVTAVLVVPPIIGALIWKQVRSSNVGATRFLWIGCPMFIAAAVCGWHYGRVWTHFGSPLLGGWEPLGQVGWWQDHGYQTAAYYGPFGESLRRPWFSGAHGFADGIYSTLWGDGLFGGNNDVRSRPPWNYELMAIGYWLALVPSVGLLLGAVQAIAEFIRRPSTEWFLLLGVGFLIAVAVVQVSLTAPYHCMIKAFYGLSGMVPLCAVGAWGLDCLGGTGIGIRLKGLPQQQSDAPTKGIGYAGAPAVMKRSVRATLAFAVGIWAINVFASFWIERGGAAAALGRARDLIKEGHFADAVPILQTSLKRHPRHRDTRYVMVPLLIGQGNLETAEKLAEDGVRDDPQSAESRLVLGMVRESEQLADQALEETSNAIALAPGWGVAHQQLAIMLSRAQRFAACILICGEALSVTPYSTEIRWCLGDALLAEKKPREADAQLQLACDLEPDRATAQARWAQILANHGRTTEAVTHYQEALWLNSALPGALNNLAWIRAASPAALLRNGREAVDLAERACRATGFDDPILIGTLAAAYAEAGRFEEAVAAATKARDLALARGRNGLAEKDKRLIQLFTNHRAFREPEEPQ